jgi:hypothetical protein
MTTTTAPDPQLALSALKDTDNAELRQEVTLRLGDVQTLVVKDAATYALAGQHYLALGALEKRITDWWQPLTDAAYKLHKALTTRRAEMVSPLVAQRDRLSREMSAWKAAQDEVQRQAERQATLDEKRRQDAIAAEQAAVLESQGQHELAAAVVQQAIDTPAPVVSLGPATPKVQGLSYRTVREHAVLNLDLVPRSFLCLDEAKVKKYHDAMKESARIPGIAFSSRDVPIGRSA